MAGIVLSFLQVAVVQVAVVQVAVLQVAFGCRSTVPVSWPVIVL
ncbi:hypothetical protein [Halorubellus salinus]|nr:hypothetical protein [Halorubellus salinus]